MADQKRSKPPGLAERLISLAEQTFGDRELANRWLHQPHPRSWDRCPISLASGTTDKHKIFELLLEIDKDIFALNPEVERPLIPVTLCRPAQDGFRVGSRGGAALTYELPRMHPPTDPSEFLRAFFQHLNKLKPTHSWAKARSHAITYQADSLRVLIGIGDFRQKIFMEGLDRDPATAAEKVVQGLEKVGE